MFESVQVCSTSTTICRSSSPTPRCTPTPRAPRRSTAATPSSAGSSRPTTRWIAGRGRPRRRAELAKEDDAFAEEIPGLEEQLATTQEKLRRLLIPRDPDDGRDVIMEIKGGEGGAESALFAADLLRMYLHYAESKGWKTEILEQHRERPRRLQGRPARHQGQLDRPGAGRLGAPQVRGRRAPRAARAGHRVAGTHPHLDDRRARLPRGRRARRGRDQPERPQDRRLPLERPRRPVGQHDRLRRAHHPPPDRHRRGHAEREEPAAEPRGRHARAARPRPRPPAGGAATPTASPCARARSAPWTARSASARTTSPRTASRITARATRRTTSTPS